MNTTRNITSTRDKHISSCLDDVQEERRSLLSPQVLALSQKVIRDDADGIDSSAFLTFPTASNITDANGAPFPLERQGIVLRAPVAGHQETGMICEMQPHALTTSTPLDLQDSSKLFSFGFTHSKQLQVGDLVRFWSKKDIPLKPGEKRKPWLTAKDVVRLAPELLTVPEQRVLLTFQQSLQTPQLDEALANFAKQQKVALAHFEANQTIVPLSSKGRRGTQQGAMRRGAGLSDISSAATAAAVPTSASTMELVPGVVQHVQQGKYGKIEVLDRYGVPRTVFFHFDVVTWEEDGNVEKKPYVWREIVPGQKVRCSYEQVRHGKHAGTLRCTSVLV